MAIIIPPKEVFTTGQVATLMSCAPRTVSKWIDSGKLKGYRLPGSSHHRVYRDDLAEFIKGTGGEVQLVPMPKPFDWQKIDEQIEPVEQPQQPEPEPVPEPEVILELPTVVEPVQPKVIKSIADCTLLLFFSKEYWIRKTRGRSEANKRLYLVAIKNLEKFLGHTPTLADFDDDTFSCWLLWYGPRGRSDETANQNVSTLLAMWRFAARKRYVAEFPSVQLLPEVRRTPDAWEEDDLRQLFATARRAPGNVGKYAACLWWSALLTVVWWTGERIGCVLRLKWSDIDLKRGFITARAETRKGGRSDAVYPIPKEALVMLAQIKGQPDELVFPWPRSMSNLYDHFKTLLHRAGLPTTRRDKFHKVRRTMASYLKRAGGDPTAQLGHSKAETTTKHYLDPKIVATKGPVELLFSPSGQKTRKGEALAS